MSLSKRPLAIALVSAWALSGIVATAQAPQEGDKAPDRFGEEVEVNEVLLDVLVTDGKGRVVVGLNKDDFVVTEDGKPVNLTGVTFYSSRKLIESAASTASKGIDVDRIPQDRYFILFFDDQRTLAGEVPRIVSQQIEAGRRARDWVKTLEPHDMVAVVGYDAKLKVYQDWTKDKGALAEAIEKAIRNKDPELNWRSRQAAEGPSLLAHMPAGNELRDKTTNIYDALRLLAEAAGHEVGRKNLLYFGTGFGRINTFGQYVPDQRYYPKTIQALNANNVAAYTIDLVPAGTTHALSDSLNQVALDTGGKFFFDVVNFEAPLSRIAEENGGYYLLSYTTEEPAGKAGFQEVKVKPANPELKIKARKGYRYGEPEAAR